MSEKRRKFDQKFREGAVRIVRETGKPIAQVARPPRPAIRTVRMSGPIAHPSVLAIREQDDQGMAASSGRSKPMLSRAPLTTSSNVYVLCGCAAP
jgi:hypothetical protein